MAGCKKKKKVSQKEFPAGKHVSRIREPENNYSQYPAWAFSNSDQEMWAFSQAHIGEAIWSEILPRLKALETQTWNEVLLHAKKQNHSIDLNILNKIARDRLASRCIEAESIISLRLTSTHRLYGYLTDSVFNILWYDDNHGDNDACVCRSRKKHT